jgi:SAM-dependent methyltransferase
MRRVISAYRAILSAIVPERHMVRGFIARHLTAREATGLCLDIGAGTAPFADALRTALPRAHYVAVDRISSEPVAVIADATSLPLPSASASLSCFFQVLSHVPDMVGALAEARRVLAPDGHILIVYPFLIPECRSRDLWRWTMPGMERLLDEAGFEIVAHEPQGGILSWLTGTLAVLPGSLLVAHRAGWRSGRGPADSLRLALALVLSFPFHLLGFAAWGLDRMLDRKPVFYLGAMVLARRRPGAG